jgi:hypothetical protein
VAMIYGRPRPRSQPGHIKKAPPPFFLGRKKLAYSVLLVWAGLAVCDSSAIRIRLENGRFPMGHFK